MARMKNILINVAERLNIPNTQAPKVVSMAKGEIDEGKWDYPFPSEQQAKEMGKAHDLVEWSYDLIMKCPDCHRHKDHEPGCSFG